MPGLLLASSVVTKARIIVSDNNTTMGLRQADSELIGWLNDALNAMLGIFPGLFAVIGNHTTVAGYMQILANPRAVMFLEVIGVPQGDAATLAQFSPNWMTTVTATAAPQEWMRVTGDPLRFQLYPPALVSNTLSVRYVKAPDPIVALTDAIPVSENYEPALVEYVAGRAETKDDEAVDSNRAMQLMDRFVASVKALSGI